jgi:hypothetical protein
VWTGVVWLGVGSGARLRVCVCVCVYGLVSCGYEWGLVLDCVCVWTGVKWL